MGARLRRTIRVWALLGLTGAIPVAEAQIPSLLQSCVPDTTDACIQIDQQSSLTVCIDLATGESCVCLLGECAAAGGSGGVPCTDCWTEIAAGGWHTCAIRGDAQAYCWGRGQRGQLGNDDTGSQRRPVLVSGDLSWASVDGGDEHTCALTTDGVAYCWGRGDSGQLGNGGTDPSRTTPAPVTVSGGDRWTSISAGLFHTCGVTTDGTGYCWGGNGNGELGDGTTTRKTTRVAVDGSRTWKHISAGGFHSCGVTTAGAAFCWGRNLQGQVGDGNPGNAPNLSPVPVSGGHTWAWVTAGRVHSCGVTTAGEAYCWGGNSSGELGTGDRTSNSTHPTPTLVLGGLQWAQLDAGPYSTCGITLDQKAYCWGWNQQGQVGNRHAGGFQDSPDAVYGDQVWRRVSSGGQQHACGIADAGEAYCWGSGSHGQLGAGSPISSNEPLEVADPQ